MTILDQLKAYARTIVQSIVDKEPLNYMEAAGLFGLLLQARHNIPILSSFYNQAQDNELKKIIKQAIYEQTIPAIEELERLMCAGNAELPEVHFSSPILHNKVDYPQKVCLTDMEIAIAIGTMARTSQLATFLSLQQCYQLEIAMALNQILNNGLQWDFRLLQLMLHRGWLPNIPKVGNRQ
ncbi:DUF3231 family protein [Sporomusa acidovorans]|uniref:Uncharacterized protein n=1 Tax=Sporomusa acidovorans (strain ATCC 49682 / DSM 3132 / Mol) TaxID=1123286 RepID=A0ABZ3J2U3_SPOA4|nr:DUF3231 family protein [Sporomusa acidovorans]OZC24099.1 hypothetical protein SPACI_02460 [Sporomusa acidovorans DSM 3132]SDF69004.1 Protein of unknown function [Sporomusa acidovorans]